MSHRPVLEYPGYYVNELGEVISTLGGVTRALRSRPHKGYQHVKITVRSDGRATQRKVPVHRLVLLAFVGPRPSPEAVCRHLDGNPSNNQPSNLAWGTHRENVEDAIRHGTAVFLRRGTGHPRGRLSTDDVMTIRQECQRGQRYAAVARRFGVDPAYISRIARGMDRRDAA